MASSLAHVAARAGFVSRYLWTRSIFRASKPTKGRPLTISSFTKLYREQFETWKETCVICKMKSFVQFEKWKQFPMQYRKRQRKLKRPYFTRMPMSIYLCCANTHKWMFCNVHYLLLPFSLCSMNWESNNNNIFSISDDIRHIIVNCDTRVVN